MSAVRTRGQKSGRVEPQPGDIAFPDLRQRYENEAPGRDARMGEGQAGDLPSGIDEEQVKIEEPWHPPLEDGGACGRLEAPAEVPQRRARAGEPGRQHGVQERSSAHALDRLGLVQAGQPERRDAEVGQDARAGEGQNGSPVALVAPEAEREGERLPQLDTSKTALAERGSVGGQGFVTRTFQSPPGKEARRIPRASQPMSSM